MDHDLCFSLKYLLSRCWGDQAKPSMYENPIMKCKFLYDTLQMKFYNTVPLPVSKSAYVGGAPQYPQVTGEARAVT